jgi:hypothetical protein
MSQIAGGIKSKLRCKAAYWETWISQVSYMIISTLSGMRNSRDCLSSIYCIRLFHRGTETKNLTDYTTKIVYGIFSAYANLRELNNRKETESADMRFLRPMAEHPLLAQNRSTDISSETQIFRLSERTERQIENWYVYILRMTRDKLRSYWKPHS